MKRRKKGRLRIHGLKERPTMKGSRVCSKREKKSGGKRPRVPNGKVLPAEKNARFCEKGRCKSGRAQGGSEQTTIIKVGKKNFSRWKIDTSHFGVEATKKHRGERKN